MAAPRCRNCGGTEFREAPGDIEEHGRCLACREFPTLGFLGGEWIESNAVIPDGDLAGQPYILTPEMWRFTLRYYRVDPFVRKNPRTGQWVLPFVYVRGAQLVRPQKWGKGPFAAAIVCVEAAPDGPVVFDGWDAAGQPVGRPWATPLIQVTAASEDQADNVWGALLPMIERGTIAADIPDTGLTRIHLPSGGKIEPVTSSALSRLGQRVTMCVQDQTESWLKRNKLRNLADTQRRGLAGMGGRWLSTCNAWDPSEDSVAQYTSEEEHDGVYHDDVDPGAGSVRNKADRRRMLRKVYGDSWWVNLDRVDAEAAAIAKRDPAQAERWLLNRKTTGSGKAFDREVWDALAKPHDLPRGSWVVLGVDGARFQDAFAIRGTEVLTGYQWTVGIWERPEQAGSDYEHPFDEIDGVMEETFDLYNVWRAYVDPQWIDHMLDKWQGRWGDKRIVGWHTNRPRQMAWAVRNFEDAIANGDLSHDGDPVCATHIGQAHKQQVNVVDDKQNRLHILAKDRPDSPRKIDGADASVVSWECRGDAIASGDEPPSGEPLIAFV